MKMLSKTGQPPCGSKCCGDRDKAHTRRMKRRERQAANAIVMAYVYGGPGAAEWAEENLSNI